MALTGIGRLASLLILAAVLAVATGKALAQSIELRPRLSDAFAAAVWRMSVDAEERVLAVSLSSNSIAMHSLEQPRPPAFIDRPIGQEESQRARPVAISPNGELLAYGLPPRRGDADQAIPGTGAVDILSRTDGRVLGRLKGLETRAQDLRFSPDGALLAGVLSNGCGLRLWRVGDWAPIAADDEGYAGAGVPADACRKAPIEQREALPDTFSVRFAGHDGRTIVTAGATGVRTYRLDETGLVRTAYRPAGESGLEKPDGLAVSPDGLTLAVGDRRVRKPGQVVRLGVAILNTADLLPAGTLRVEGASLQIPEVLDPTVAPGAEQLNLARVAWLRQAGVDWLLAAGTFPCVAARVDLLLIAPQAVRREICAVLWRRDQPAQPRFMPLGTDQIVDVVALPKRGALVGVSNRTLRGFRVDGEPLFTGAAGGERVLLNRDAATFDFRDVPVLESRLDFRLSKDASIVQVADYEAVTRGRTARLTFDVRALALGEGEGSREDLSAAQYDPALSGPLNSWVNQTIPPLIFGRPIAGIGRAPDVYRALAPLPEQRLLLVSANFLHVVQAGRETSRVLCRLRVQSEGFRVNASQDGRWVVVGHGDGTLRWYRLEFNTGQSCRLSPTLSVHLSKAVESSGGADRWNWVAWHEPSGRFATNGRAPNPLSWQFPGSECSGTTVGFSDLTSSLFDRKTVARALDDQAPQGSGTDPLIAQVARYCGTTSMAVERPLSKARVTTPTVTVDVRWQGMAPAAKGLLLQLGDDTRLAKEDASGRIYAEDEPIPVTASQSLRLKVRLPVRQLRANTDFQICFLLGVFKHCHPLLWGGHADVEQPRRLWAVLVGAGDYDDPQTVGNLRFAGNDAVDLARLFAGDKAKAEAAGRESEFQSVSIDLLVSSRSNEIDLKALASPQLRVGRATEDGILQALNRVADESKAADGGRNLFVFHFSGHGQATPNESDVGHSALILPSDPSQPPRWFSSSKLIDAIRRIRSDKVVVIDACSTLAAAGGSSGFDPAKVQNEFLSAMRTANLMLSGHPGQASRESAALAFDSSRRESVGNGLFTFALLRALTDRGADTPKSVHHIGKITVEEARDHIDEYFAKQSETSPLFQQRPLIIPGAKSERTVLRRLDSEP